MPVLRPGDALRVTVWRQAELSGEFEIAGDSTLAHPLYQQVKVAGLPLAEVRQRLLRFLSQFEENPQVALVPLLRVAVGGEVRQPSLYTFPPELTVTQAVARAGGPTERGRLDQVVLIRGGERVVFDASDARSSAATVLVRSGDQILVPRRRNLFREYIAPAASVAGAAASIVNVILRNRR
ncbi:MAG: polysaccharide export protein [Gemmatimonadetes bacterium]|nr:polysaccharide export protein [Gemmatimonadota bacterium]